MIIIVCFTLCFDQEDPSQHDQKNVDWKVKNQTEQTKIICLLLLFKNKFFKNSFQDSLSMCQTV